MEPKLEQANAAKALTDLPNDLHVKILSHAASNSVTDLLNFKRTCKYLHEAGSQPGVLRNAAVLNQLRSMSGRKPNRQQNDGASQFIDACMEDDNLEALEALFYRGVEELANQEPDRKNYLVKAAWKGHVAARYLCGIVRLVGGQCELGLKFLQRLRPQKPEELDNLNDCRRAVGVAIGWLRSARAAEEPTSRTRGFVSWSVRALVASGLEKDGKGCGGSYDVAGVSRGGGCGVIGSEGRVCDSCFWITETCELLLSLDQHLDLLTRQLFFSNVKTETC